MIDNDGSAGAYTGQGDAEGEKPEYRIRVLGMLQSEQLCDEYAEEGKSQRGAEVPQICPLEGCVRGG
ncbi:MAG: hypothetical protein Q9219_006171 [cf. Caloplaca sp. 3 TL-2023]